MAAPRSAQGDFQREIVQMKKRLDSLDRRKSAGLVALEIGNRDVPSPPTNVEYESITVGGDPAMRSTWDAPTTNTDGTELTDLWGYQIQQQIGLTVTWEDPDAVAPAKPDSTLNRMVNRNGMGEGWTGGDGGASHRDSSGKDWWFWSDSNWGALNGSGETIKWFMLRNSITSTVGTDPNSMEMFTGFENWFTPERMAPAKWSGNGVSTVAIPQGLRWTPGGTGAKSLYLNVPERMPVTPGQTVTLSCRSSAPGVTLRIQFQRADGVNISPAPQVTSVEGVEITSISATAPAETARVVPVFVATSVDPIDITQVYLSAAHAPMASWREGVKTYQYTNRVPNPEGAGKQTGTATFEAWRNRAIAPSAEYSNSTSIGALYSSATVTRVASSTAFVGSHVHRVNRNVAGNGNLVMLDYRVGSGTGAAGKKVTYRLRVRKGQIASPSSRLTANLYFYNSSGSRLTPDGTSVTVALTDDWQEIVVNAASAPTDTDRIGLMLYASGTAWSASDYFEIDARELYVGNETLPPSYFDGSTPDRPGWAFSWAGIPGWSDSIMTSTPVQRRNLALAPLLAFGWTGVNGATVRTDASSVPSGGTGVLLPTVTNPGALSSLRGLLANPNALAGIGVIGDSTAETTGSLSNPDLSDRWIETLQRELRRVQGSPGVRISPEGYYGASAYVAARYQHDGPIDWEVRGPKTDVSDMGVGGKAFGLPYGSSAHLRATFDSAIVELPKHGWGRIAVIYVDGEEKARLDTLGDTGDLIQWDTGSLGYGEHLISVESQRNPNLDPGDIRIAGAQLFDEANRTRGTRVYDMAMSGESLQRFLQYPHIMEYNLARPLDLLVISLDFNDAGMDVTPAQHKTNYQTAISRARALGFAGKFLIVSKWTPSTNVTSQWTYTMDQYRAVMKEVAEADSGVAYIDLGEVMPNPDDEPSLYDDWLHPSEIGHQRIAAIMRGVILNQTSELSALVSTDAAGEGADFSGFAANAFDNRKVFTSTVQVQGPAGRKVRARVVVPGMADDLSADLTLDGSWQPLAVTAEVSLAATSASPKVRVEQADSGGVMQFRVGRPLVEEGVVSNEFFYSGTPDTQVVDYGSLPNGESVARSYEPVGVTTTGKARVSFDPDRRHDFTGSVRVDLYEASTATDFALASATGYAGAHMIALWAYSETDGATVNLQMKVRDSGGAVSSVGLKSESIPAGEWTEIRALATPPAGSTLVGARAITYDPTVWLTEITAVEGNYSGPTFSGGSRGAHATSAWTGTPHASTSVLSMSNTSYAHDMLQHTSLITPEAAGLEAWKFLWCQGAIGDGDTAVMFLQGFYHRPMAEESGWNFERSGEIVAAKFDLASQTLIDVYLVMGPSDYQWGEGLWIDEDVLYCYGGQAGLTGTEPGSVALRRWPKAAMHGQLLQSDSSVWTGSAWGPGSATPGPVAALPIPGGFSAVRKLGDRWVALFTAGFMDHLQSWEATSPTGPFEPIDVVYAYPSDGINRYVPRFHPQFDSGELGVSMALCESGNGKYAPLFLRGPSGTRVAGFGDAYWGETRWAETPEHIEPDVEPGTPYRVRVRAVDTFGNPSEWAVGEEAWTGGEEPVVKRPSTPIASSFFRGGRVFWDGRDEHGEEYPGFRHYEVHLNKGGQEFDPNNWTRVDSSIVAGGVTPITVEDYSTYYVGIVVVTDAGRSEMSETVPFQPERLSDPDLGQTLIDGARLKPGTVNASALTVGSFTDNLLPNANFEQPSLTDPTKPSMWTSGWPRGDRDWGTTPWEDAGTWERTEVDPIAGSASLKITTPVDTWLQVLSDPPIPVQPGDIYYVAARLRTDGIDGEVEISLLMGETEDDVNGFASESNARAVVGVTAGGQSGVLVEGPVEVPDVRGDGSGKPMRFAAVAVEAKATGREYTTWVDNVDVKRVVGEAAIADASINRAKIRYLAVDDARIASVGVGKLVAGELFADITVSARIMTSKTGKRWEANQNGSFTFNPALTGGDDQIPVTQMRASDGGLISRWFRTNSSGTRIEMGTYGMGANSALISFHPSASEWQFPPAFGFGGAFRQGSIPGLAMHAGSFSEYQYGRFGMNMLAIDQASGIVGLTGILLDGSESTVGSPIRFNAGGPSSYIQLKSGGVNASDPAQLLLDPTPGESFLSLNTGSIFLQSASAQASDHYEITFVFGSEWMGTNHMHIKTGFGGLRVSNGASDRALWLNGTRMEVPGVISAGTYFARGSGAARLLVKGGGSTIEFDQWGNPWTNSGNDRATNAMWIEDGLVTGNGAWGVPRIKTRNSTSYVSWDNTGGVYIDGSPVKSFVIPHPVDEEKYLVHAAHEGDDMRVVYEGTDSARGGKTLQLPDYFEALVEPGSDVVFVQALADVDRPLCECSVKSTRVKGGRFAVFVIPDDGCKGDREHEVEFSWRVTAIRAGTAFETEPLVRDTVVRGDGPYTYIERPSVGSGHGHAD